MSLKRPDTARSLTFAASVLVGWVSLCLAKPAPAQGEAPALKPSGVYVAAYQTPRHVKFSKPDVFHGIAAGVVEFLLSNHIGIVEDPVRKRIEIADFIPSATLVNIARDAGASSLVYITVDRPLTKWVKITVEAYDLSGALLWKEIVDEGGGHSGKGGVQKALEKLKKRLQPKIGLPGLIPAPAPASEDKTSNTAAPR